MAAFKSVFAATALAVVAPFALAQPSPAPIDSEQVVLIADSLFENEEDNTVIAEGNVEASYQGRTLKADRIVYNRNTNKVRATGNVIILDEDGTERFAEEVEVSSNLSDGYAVGFSVRMPNGGQAVANSAIRQEGGINALDQVVYTSCEMCDENDTPTWALRARRAVLDEEDQMISYRDAVLEVAGVPVFYLPYFAHPDPGSERRSGLLFPDLGISSKVGAFYQQPYYWAVSDHQELTIAPAFYAKVNPLLELDYSKRFWSGRLNINTSVTQEYEFDGDGEQVEGSEESVRSHVFADGLFALNKTWDWGFGLERASDDLYLRRYDIDGEGDQRGLYTGRPRRLLSQLFLVGQSEDFYSETAVLSVQGLRAADDNDTIPLVAPVALTKRSFDMGAYGRTTVAASVASLTRDVGEDSQRVSVGADWSQRSVLPGGFLLEPFADIRADYYALDEEYSGEPDVTRALGSSGVRLSYPLIRRGEQVDILIEPIAMGAWGVSGANDDPIPIEDSEFFEVDTSTLFDSNGAAGYDLYEGDGRAALGIRAQARWRNGVTLSTEAGRRWRSTADPAFESYTNLQGTSSDWVTNTSLDLGRSLRLQANMRLDDETLDINRIDAKVETDIWRLSAAVQYFQLSDTLRPDGVGEEGALVRGSFRLSDNFSLSYSQQRDIQDGFNTARVVGLSYSDNCSVFSVGYERRDSRDRDLGPSESITFRFTLRTLGAFGSSELD